MLIKRAHILFDEKLWNRLVLDAKRQQTSVGNLVRTTMKEKYEREETLKTIQDAVEAIKKHRPPVSKTPINYKELINYGRKY